MNYNLSDIVSESLSLKQIRKNSLAEGDRIILKTSNSIYSIKVLGYELYSVTGGWFDKNNNSSASISIRGCTWGGNVIKTDIVAACGLNLEFGNKVVTSKIEEITYITSR